MTEFVNEVFSNVLMIGAAFCVVSLIVIALTLYWIFKRIGKYADVDVSNLQETYEHLRRSYPEETDERIIRHIIKQQAYKSGMVGAATSIGGLVTMPIALPADIILSTQIQAAMVEFIASFYGQRESGEVERRLRTYAVATGGVQMSESTVRWMMKFAVRILGKSFAKFLPIVGAFIGYSVNYSITRTTGNLALQWYASRKR